MVIQHALVPGIVSIIETNVVNYGKFSNKFVVFK